MPIKIYKRGKVWHYAGTVAGRRLRGTTRATDKATAQRIAAEVEAKYWRRHLDGPEAELSFAQAAMLYREAEKPTRFLNRIEDHWRDTPVRDITAGAIRQSAIKLFPNGKGATRNRQVIVPTQAIINHAADMEFCNRIKVKRFEVETKTKKPVTREWVNSFVANASPHLGALCIFMFGTGARITEALNLTWRDVDLSEATARINQTKIGDERHAHLPQPVTIALANIGGNRNPNEWVFPYAARDSVYQVWNNVIERAGIKRLTPHSCRHGFATTLLHAGVDVKTIAKLGGWKDETQVLKTYGHALDDTTLTNKIFDKPLTQAELDQPVTIRKERKIS